MIKRFICQFATYAPRMVLVFSPQIISEKPFVPPPPKNQHTRNYTSRGAPEGPLNGTPLPRGTTTTYLYTLPQTEIRHNQQVSHTPKHTCNLFTFTPTQAHHQPFATMSFMKLAVMLCVTMITSGIFTTRQMAYAHRPYRRDMLQGTC